MTEIEAENKVRSYILEERANKIIAEASTGPKPKLYLINAQSGIGVTVQTVMGPLTSVDTTANGTNAVDPVSYAFFVDDKPEANWQHSCRYVFVHDSGQLTVEYSTAPPSSKENYVLTEVRNLFPEDKLV